MKPTPGQMRRCWECQYEFGPQPYALFPMSDCCPNCGGQATRKVIDAMASLEMWEEVNHIGYDNSDPPQLWAWRGAHDESAEPWFRIKFADVVDTIQMLFARVAELDRSNND